MSDELIKVRMRRDVGFGYRRGLAYEVAEEVADVWLNLGVAELAKSQSPAKGGGKSDEDEAPRGEPEPEDKPKPKARRRSRKSKSKAE